MSKIKINPDIFLESQELNRLVKFLEDDGFRKLLLQNSSSFGIVDISKDGEFDNFLIQQGTNTGTIKNAAGLAIDKNGQLITRLSTDNISLTDDSNWYWVKIKYTTSNIEQGTVSIDRQGNLTGVGTEFLSILRGVPNIPVRVRFEGTSLNTLEYDVHEVIDDENAVLQGVFESESDLQLVVVGSFTPDIVPPSQSKDIYQYDSCTMTLVQETVLNTPPTLIDGEEFVIARVRRVGSNITIQDKRSRNIFKTKSDFDLNTVTTPNNPLIGVEAVKFNHNNTPRDRNVVYVGWGLRSSNWTFDASVNRVTIIGGLGGKFKTTSDFTDGDFDGWRLYSAKYASTGQYRTIKQSSVAGLQINLILDTLDADDLNADLNQELIIVPPVEQIELIARTPGGESELPEQRFLFPINQGYAKLQLVVYKDPTCQYELSYRYKNFKTYSPEALIPDDTTSGYLIEAAFDVNGTQQSSTRQTYENGLITLVLATNAYANRIASVETGDLFGIEYLEVDTAVTPVMDFVVGTRRQYVVVTNDDDLDESDSDFGTEYQLIADAFINLRSDLPATGLKNGNSFLIQFRGPYDLNGNVFKIVQDYVNPGDTGIELYNLTQDDLTQAAADNLFFRCLWDGTRWFVQKMIHFNEDLISDTIQFIIDGGGTTITTGEKGHIEVPFNCEVIGWSVFANQPGSIVVDIWKGTYANFPPTVADTITGSEKPTLSAATKNQDLTLSTWTPALTKGQVLAYNVDSVTSVQRVTISLHVRKI